MMNITAFKYYQAINLSEDGDCYLLGMDWEGDMWCEIITPDDELIRFKICQGSICEIERETETEIAPFSLDDGFKPNSMPTVHPLNSKAPRLRGIREEDRISEWVQPLTIMEKMTIIERLKLSVSPMQMLGIADSTVLSYAELPDGTQIVCRRVRLAYALPQMNYDPYPYDYDNLPIYVIHRYDPMNDELPSWETMLGDFAGVSLQRPTDCLLSPAHLVVADSSADGKKCRLLVWLFYPKLL